MATSSLTLLIFSILPTVLILLYIYSRKKYEQEPKSMLFKAFTLGILSAIIIIIGALLTNISIKAGGTVLDAFIDAFFWAAIPEEVVKFIMLYLLIWNNKHFEERFDGVIYSVFVSMGFATLENILYVSQSGLDVAILRAITAVPAHALFGIAMGYYFSYAKFMLDRKKKYIFMSISIPIVLHGIYDFLLLWRVTLKENNLVFSVILLMLFLTFVLFLWHQGFKKIKKLSSDFYFQGIPQSELQEFIAIQNNVNNTTNNKSVSFRPLPPQQKHNALSLKQNFLNWQDITPELFSTEKEDILSQFPNSIMEFTNGIISVGIVVNKRHQWLLQLTYARNYRKIKNQLRVYIIEPDFDELISISGDIPRVKTDLSGNKYLALDSENNINGASNIQNAIRWIDLFEKWVDGEIEMNQFTINL
jgi:RsiW-degrading membrane proteinase PrsW (M82 family)